MTDPKHSSGSKREFRLGVLFVSLGIAFLSPLIYRSQDSFKDHNVVGPFFGISLGLTFLVVGALRISKSRRPGKVSSDGISASESDSPTNGNEKPINSVNTDNPRTPVFIKWVAWSPAIPLSVMLAAQAGCDTFGLNTCREHYAVMEAMAYLGGLGWVVSLPIAGMLKMIHSAAK